MIFFNTRLRNTENSKLQIEMFLQINSLNKQNILHKALSKWNDLN